MSRYFGKSYDSLLTLKTKLETGIEVLIPGCKDPESIVTFMRNSGIEVVSKVVSKLPNYQPLTGIQPKREFTGYSFKLK